MATARLTGFAAVGAAVVLATMAPDVTGTRLVSLLGWAGAVAVTIGLLVGEPRAVVFAGGAFVIRIAILSFVLEGLAPPVWVQVALLALVFETATISLEARTGTVIPSRAGTQIAATVMIATGVALVMEAALSGVTVEGTILRVVAIGSVVVLAGWVALKWRTVLGQD